MQEKENRRESPQGDEWSRKILHIDMDCFYAAIEMRERPELRGQPLAVGGSSDRRGVLTTCNYEARSYGCRSAMPTFQALQRCPHLQVVPVRFELYRRESARIHRIFRNYTDRIEPLSLDEAYLDVSQLRSAGSAVASEIRYQIRQRMGLTASAGIAPNKLLAKIASDWNKPDGQFEITPTEIPGFMHELPVRRIWGVGKVTAERLARLGVQTCGDLQRLDLPELMREFGKFGSELHSLCRGKDEREVKVSRERKSLSNERTYREDLADLPACLAAMDPLIQELEEDLAAKCSSRTVRKVFVKLKFSDFRKTTVERVSTWPPPPDLFPALLEEGWGRGQGKPVRLLGTGVRFTPRNDDKTAADQMDMFTVGG